MSEELRRDDAADGVTAQVFRARRAAAVPVEAGHGVIAARLKLAAEHVPLAHGRSIT
jgi:hypothetical protein